MEKRCFFIGSRDTPNSILPRLMEAVEQHITEYGVTEFVIGGYGRFDALATKAVRQAKERHPNVQMTYLRPYHPEERQIELPEGFDGSLYPPGMERTPKRVSIVRANRYMVDHSDFLIAYAPYVGNSRELVDYARRREARGAMRILLLEIDPK